MPKLWTQTIDAHRREVRDAVLDTAAALAAEHGPLTVTMSRIAEEVGIGRATLYKYFSSVEEILHAWHDRQITRHLGQLLHIAERDAPAFARLGAVLEAYADMQRHQADHGDRPHGGELALLLHRSERLVPAVRQLRELLGGLLRDAAADGEVRSDVPADDLTRYCLHALEGARDAGSRAAARRLVTVILDGLRPRDA